MCKSSVHNYLKKRICYSKHTKGNVSHFLQKYNVKIDFDLQRNNKICLKKNWKTMCLVTNHQCICFMHKIEKKTLFSEAKKIKSLLPKQLKRVRM